MIKSIDIWKSGKFSSGKWSHYFEIYDELLGDYRGKKITFVEVGVKDGGSLEFFRKYLGQEARIIGIDVDPRVCDLKGDFEIRIGDAGSPDFWKEFSKEIGDIDIMLDDGSHQIKHQILTLEMCIDNHLRGILIIEDVQSNFRTDFNDGSSYTLFDHVSGISRIMTLSSFDSNSLGCNTLVDPHLIERYKYVKKISFFQNIIAVTFDNSNTPGFEINNGAIPGDEMKLPIFESFEVRDLTELTIQKWISTPNSNGGWLSRLRSRLYS